MNKSEEWFSFSLLGVALVVFAFFSCRSYYRESKSKCVRDRIVDSLHGKLYCKECRRHENITLASVSFFQTAGDGEYYVASFRTDGHKDPAEGCFVYSAFSNNRSGEVSIQEQTGGPGFDR